MSVCVNKGGCGNERCLLSPALLKGLVCNLFEVDQLLSSINTICMIQIERGREVEVVWVWTGGWMDGNSVYVTHLLV